MGDLGHLFEELVGGAWRDRSHGDERHDAALCRAARQRHGTLHPRQPRARREDGLEEEPELVGQADRKCRRGGVHADSQRRDARRGAALGRDRLDGSGAAQRSGPGQRQSGNRRCSPARRFGPSSSAWTSPATNSAIPASRARTRSRTFAFARRSIRRSTRTRSTRRSCADRRRRSALMIAPSLFSLLEGLPSASLRSRGVEEAARRGRLSRRVRGAAGLPERSLRQRRADLSGGRRHAGAGRGQGRSERRAQIEVLRRDLRRGRLRQLVLSAGVDADDARELQRLPIHHGLPRSEDQLGRQQCRRLLQPEGRRARPQGASRSRTRRSATTISPRPSESPLFDDVSYIPLHQQALAWGVSKTTHVIQPAGQLLRLCLGHEGLTGRSTSRLGEPASTIALSIGRRLADDRLYPPPGLSRRSAS